MAKVSIVIPCYNARDYITKCLDSLTRQSFKDFDVFLVNDCSTDDTEAIIKEYVKKSLLDIHYIQNTVNSGPSLSRYYGAKASTSEWVTFCDSDDWYEDAFLAHMIAQAENEKCDIVFCGYQNVIGEKIDKHPLSDETKTYKAREAMYLNVDSLCMTLVKRSIYVATPQPDLRNGEDLALVPLLIQGATKVGVLFEVLYNYYIRPGSASLSPNEKMIDSLIKSFKHIDTYLTEQFTEEKEYLGIRNLIYGALLNLFKYSYNTTKADLILSDFETKFPSWEKNKGISTLPLFKRVYVKCAKHRLYFMLFILSRFHSFMLK